MVVKAHQIMKKINILIIFIFVTVIAFSQNKPSSFQFTLVESEQYIYTEKGWGGSYNSSNDYNLHFGYDDAGIKSEDNLIGDFTFNGKDYSAITLPNDECFSNIKVNRVISNDNGNSPVQDLKKQTLFFERANKNGSDLYFTPTYTKIEEAVNKRIHNRGGDNIFANTNSKTTNNIERIDMIIESGAFSINVNETGFLINERGGNDRVKVAAITSLNSKNEVDGLGSLVTIDTSDWANTGKSITTTVFQRDSSDKDMRPAQDLSSQYIHGCYITYNDLGISTNDTIYGMAIFPGDVSSSMDLVGLRDVPLDTDGNSINAGGLDLMGGGGYFASEDLHIVDLDMSISSEKNAPDGGEDVDITFTGFNNGPLNDSNIVMNLEIPDGYSLNSVKSVTRGTYTVNRANTITWNVDQMLNGQSDTLVVSVETQASGNRVFAVTINGSLTDVVPGNNNSKLELLTKSEQQGLPVELVYFDGENNGNSNLLEWETASEINNEYFLIEKSDKGENFESFATVEGAGNSNTLRSYSYTDQNPYEGITYYRLIQFDFDGKKEVYKPIAVKSSFNDQPMSAYPNPTTGNFILSNLEKGERIVIVNSNGQVIYENVANSVSFNINLSDKPSGFYFIRNPDNKNQKINLIVK